MGSMRLALVALAGCSFQAKPAATGTPDGSPMHDARVIDAAIDSPPDAFDDRCFGSGGFYVCLTAVPTGSRMCHRGILESTTKPSAGNDS